MFDGWCFGGPLRAALLSFSMLLAAGCSIQPTPYQAVDKGYGYSQQQLDGRTWRVEFSGNSVTSRATVENYLLYRAAEIMPLRRKPDWLCTHSAKLTTLEKKPMNNLNIRTRLAIALLVPTIGLIVYASMLPLKTVRSTHAGGEYTITKWMTAGSPRRSTKLNQGW